MKEELLSSLTSGITRMNEAELKHRGTTEKQMKKLSDDFELDELTLTHTYSESATRKILGINHVAFKGILKEAIEKGIISAPYKHVNTYKYSIQHIHALQNYLGHPQWKDKFNGIEVVVVNNLKGGTGKTTLTVSLAIEMALMHRHRPRVLIIDLDPQGSLAKYTNIEMNDSSILTAVDLMLGSQENDSIYAQYKEHGYSHTDLVKGAVVSTHVPNLDILPSHPNDERYLNDVLKMKLRAIRSNPEESDSIYNDLLQTEIIDHIKDDYDLVFIDTTPQKNLLVATAVDAATGLLIPCAPHELDWDSTQKHLNALPALINEETPSQGEKLKWWKVVGTIYEAEYDRDAALFERMREALSTNLFSSPLERSHAFEVAVQNRITIRDILPSHKAVPAKQLKKGQDSLRAVARDLIHLMLNHSSVNEENKDKDNK